MARKATVEVSDTHFGDKAQLHDTLHDCMDRAIEIVGKFEPDIVEVDVDGDAAAGKGIFRNQETQNIVQLGGEQVWWAAWEFLGWHKRLGATRWNIIKGNHDNSAKENLAIQLAMVMHLLGIPVRYCDRALVANFAEPVRADQWYQVEHGAGVSSYHANSYSEIRNCMRKAMEISYADGIRISRFLRAHSHWMNVGQAIGLECAIDTTGGWHRQERLELGGDIRSTGMIVYLHDGEKLDIIPVPADSHLLISESRSLRLGYRNMEIASQALQNVSEWLYNTLGTEELC
jgi:hypothetical protein